MESVRGAPGLLDYVGVLLRRKWLVLLTILLVPTAAVGVSLRQTPTYAAAALVLVDTQSADPSTQFVDPDRLLATDAKLARIPAVAALALQSVPESKLTIDSFLRESSVSAAPGTDFLTFSVKSTDRRGAVKLTNAYARAFTRYQQDANLSSLKSVKSRVALAIAKLRAAGGKGTTPYRNLVEQQRELDAQIASAQPASNLSRPADTPYQVAPRTLRNAAIAVFLGLVLAVMVAFAADALDSAVRSTDVLRRKWGLPLLGELPRPPRPIERSNALVMLADPAGHHAERFRVLRTSVEFANATDARTIAVTSAVDGEGKSTTVANLAVALARAGKQVAIVDADLRHPSLHRLFNLDDTPGLVDVASGGADLSQALQPIRLDDGASNGAALARHSGRLYVLPAGQPLHDPDRLGAAAAVARVTNTLRERFDLVLIDTPPLLRVGDTIALSAHVDALLLVSRLKMLSTSAVERTRRILEATPAATLGFIVTDTDAGDTYSHYRYGYGDGRKPTAPAPVVARPEASAAEKSGPAPRQRGILRRPR